jgi:hypothetical protein
MSTLTSRTIDRNCPMCNARILTEFEPAPINLQMDGQVTCDACGWRSEVGQGVAGRVINRFQNPGRPSE